MMIIASFLYFFLLVWSWLLVLAALSAFGFTRWLKLVALTVWRTVSFHFVRTFILRRECAWCQPMRYIGGNPFSKRVTHGMCPACLEKQAGEINALNEAQPVFKISPLSR